VFEKLKKSSRARDSVFKGRSIPVAVILMIVVLLSAGSGFVGASFFAQQSPNVTVTTTVWSTSTVWSTVTAVVQGVWTTVQYTTSTSTVMVTDKPVIRYGNTQIDTAQSMFGGASGLFASGDALITPDSADWTFGSDDFTIDFWVRLSSVTSNIGMFSHYTNAKNYVELIYVAGQGFNFRAVNGGVSVVNLAQTNSPISANTWYHLAVVRSGASFNIYKDGVSIASTSSSSSMPDPTGNFQIGYAFYIKGGSSWMNGWLDEFRVSKGIARWTSNFTPPTSAYSRDAYTVLLIHMDGADASTAFADSY
jgi:hypothetical protein